MDGRKRRPGVGKQSFVGYWIDTNHEFTWTIEWSDTSESELTARVVRRTAAQRQFGCDGCGRRHEPLAKHCGANGGTRIPAGPDDGSIQLVSLRADRKVYPGTWSVTSITWGVDSHGGCGTVGVVKCARVT